MTAFFLGVAVTVTAFLIVDGLFGFGPFRRLARWWRG